MKKKSENNNIVTNIYYIFEYMFGFSILKLKQKQTNGKTFLIPNEEEEE